MWCVNSRGCLNLNKYGTCTVKPILNGHLKIPLNCAISTVRIQQDNITVSVKTGSFQDFFSVKIHVHVLDFVTYHV